jgi:antitoxin component YwqK of YwqJK toxin-antitoxin module
MIRSIRFVTILLVFAVCSCNNNESSKNEFSFEEVYFQDDQRRAFNKIDNSPITGSVIQKNKNGKKIIEWPYKNGVLDGYIRIWSDSILEFEFYYIDGIENGKWRAWYDKENLSYEQSYKNGINDGVWKGWHKNREQSFEESYMGGKRAGKWKEWYENGQSTYEVNYKDGLEEGIAKCYHENGKLEKEVNFNNGKKEEFLQVFFPSGKIKAKYSYKEGKRNGTCINYYESGQIRSSFNYLNDELNGLCQAFFENGKLRGEGNFEKNQSINVKVYDNSNNLIFSKSNGKKYRSNKEIVDPFKEDDFVRGAGFFGDSLKEDFLFHPWDKLRIFEGHKSTIMISRLAKIDYYNSILSDKRKVGNKK